MFYLHVYPETEYTPARGHHTPDEPTGKWVLSHSSLDDPHHGGGQMLMVGTKDEVMKAANQTSVNTGGKTVVKVWDKVGESVERIVNHLLSEKKQPRCPTCGWDEADPVGDGWVKCRDCGNEYKAGPGEDDIPGR